MDIGLYQILSDIFQYPLNIVKASEGPALGVAILAGVWAGIYSSVEDACDRIIQKTSNNVTPNNELKETYEKVYAVYNSLYGRIKDI